MMYAIYFLLIGSLILFSCGCQASSSSLLSTSDILNAMLAETSPVAGKTYLLNGENPSNRMSDELLKGLYGEEAVDFQNNGASAVNDGAIYLSEVMHPYELAVFRCVSEADIWNGSRGIMAICATRLDRVRKAWQGSEYQNIVEGGIVTCYENYVILVIAEDAESIVDAAKKRIRQG